jgi:hypothetical protein
MVVHEILAALFCLPNFRELELVLPMAMNWESKACCHWLARRRSKLPVVACYFIDLILNNLTGEPSQIVN